MLCLVLLAMFALITLTLSALVALAWCAGLKHRLAASADLLALRLLPAAGAVLLVLTVVLPAFLSQEPHQVRETAGPMLVVLGALSFVALAHGIWRGWQACAAARALLRHCGPPRRWLVAGGQKVHVVDVPEPLVAVIGGWRPRIVAAECVIGACSPEEFQQVMAHEAAHVSARDNLKQLLLIASPDLLAWTPVGAVLAQRWRAAAEIEADQRATQNDSRRRLALAAALIKVARALGAREGGLPVLSLPVASDDVGGRVRQLLAPPDASSQRAASARAVIACALLTPVAALPLYPWVHELIETLVRLGL
jgi:Zn-dependent protease with chaperone function